MGSPAIREVILVPFPYSDLSQAKVRPALCLAQAQRGDWTLCQITSSRMVIQPQFLLARATSRAVASRGTVLLGLVY